MKYLLILILAGTGLWLYLLPAPVRGHRMSSANVYFLLDYVSVQTERGVTGFSPGQEVHRVPGYQKGKVSVTDGSNVMWVDTSLLTQDIDLAEELARQDAQGQAALAAQRSSEIKKQLASQTAANIASAQDIQRESQRRAAANAVGSHTRLDDPAEAKGGYPWGYSYGPYYTSPNSRSAYPAYPTYSTYH